MNDSKKFLSRVSEEFILEKTFNLLIISILQNDVRDFKNQIDNLAAFLEKINFRTGYYDYWINFLV